MPVDDKAELSGMSAQTKLMAFGYKAELSGMSAQTKLMAFGYKHCLTGIIGLCCEDEAMIFSIFTVSRKQKSGVPDSRILRLGVISITCNEILLNHGKTYHIFPK